MNLGLKYIIYLSIFLTGGFISKINPKQEFSIYSEINKVDHLAFTNSKGTKLDFFLINDHTERKQHTYRRCYQANSLIRQVGSITLIIYTCFDDIRFLVNKKVEFYFSIIRDIRIGLPKPKIIYPFNYFWDTTSSY